MNATAMDINILRSAVTVIAFACFLGIVWWAYSARSRQGFEEAAQLPFSDDELSAAPRNEGKTS